MGELTWWLSPHPAWEPGENWPQEVPVVRYDTDDAVVLIDPFLPPDGTFDPHGKPVRVLLTAPWHERGTPDFVERFGASVWPRTTTELPAGVQAVSPDGDPVETLFFVPEHRVLVTGDVFSGTGGRFHVFFADEVDDREAYLRSLERLADLPVERVIVAHGEPILADGAARIRAAVAEARAG
jgi:glyoxylase-like metal-dependent hydrolase (beta-lactamase superfamily II)